MEEVIYVSHSFQILTKIVSREEGDRGGLVFFVGFCLILHLMRLEKLHKFQGIFYKVNILY